MDKLTINYQVEVESVLITEKDVYFELWSHNIFFKIHFTGVTTIQKINDFKEAPTYKKIENLMNENKPQHIYLVHKDSLEKMRKEQNSFNQLLQTKKIINLFYKEAKFSLKKGKVLLEELQDNPFDDDDDDEYEKESKDIKKDKIFEKLKSEEYQLIKIIQDKNIYENHFIFDMDDRCLYFPLQYTLYFNKQLERHNGNPFDDNIAPENIFKMNKILTKAITNVSRYTNEKGDVKVEKIQMNLQKIGFVIPLIPEISPYTSKINMSGKKFLIYKNKIEPIDSQNYQDAWNLTNLMDDETSFSKLEIATLFLMKILKMDEKLEFNTSIFFECLEYEEEVQMFNKIWFNYKLNNSLEQSVKTISKNKI